jgi:hypothetical protein
MRRAVNFHRHCEERSDEAIQKRRRRLDCFASLAMTTLAIAASGAAHARDIEMGGDSNYPYSIMTPEPGTGHHRAAAPVPARSRHLKSPGAEKPLATRSYAVRGTSGVVLPTPLPKTQLIPPEGGSAPIIHTGPQEQGPTVLPGMNPIPNLPHGTETFQDRASRCAQQQGLYGVPATATGIYMHTCAM